MTGQSQALLDSFEALSAAEQREVVAEILRRSLTLDYPPLTDEELVQIADERFQELDRREAQDG